MVQGHGETKTDKKKQDSTSNVNYTHMQELKLSALLIWKCPRNVLSIEVFVLQEFMVKHSQLSDMVNAKYLLL